MSDTTGKHLYIDGIFLRRWLLVGAVGIASEVIAQQRGRRCSLAVGVGQAMPTATVGIDMAVGVAYFLFPHLYLYFS
jgi:hypothetical protein